MTPSQIIVVGSGLSVMLLLFGAAAWVSRRRKQAPALPPAATEAKGRGQLPGPNDGNTALVPRPAPGPNDGNTALVPRPAPGPNDGDTEFVPRPAPGPNDGDTEFVPRPAPGPSDGDTEFVPRPAPGPNDGDTEFVPRDEDLGRPVRKTVLLHDEPATSTPQQLVTAEVYAAHLAGAGAALAQFEAALVSGSSGGELELDALDDGPLRSWETNLSLLRLADASVNDEQLQPYLAGLAGEPSHQTTAILLSLRRDTSAARRSILSSLDGPLPASMRQAIQRAVTLWDDPRADELARAAFDAAADDVRAAHWLNTLNSRGAAIDEPTRARALDSSEPLLLAAGLRTLTPETATSLRVRIEHQLVAKHDAVRMAAIEAGILIGSQAAWINCRQCARKPNFARACELMGSFGGPRERQALQQWAQSSPVRIAALTSLGTSGRLADLDICVAQLDDPAPEVAAAALVAFSRASGYAGANEPAAVRSWWTEKRARLDANPDGRYIGGQPYTVATAAAALRKGPATQRATLARELWFRSGGRLRVRHDQFPVVQRRDINALEQLELDFLVDPA